MSPHDAVTVEIAWCPGCQTDRTVEVVALAGDPGPVAVCVDCGLGIETWWSPELSSTARPRVARAS
ncbi:MAG: hypothetical protein ACRDSP_05715 [Pseudonocardiaceae bacterium]